MALDRTTRVLGGGNDPKEEKITAHYYLHETSFIIYPAETMIKLKKRSKQRSFLTDRLLRIRDDFEKQLLHKRVVAVDVAS